MKSKQQGFFLVIAVIFIMVIGFMGTMIAYMLSSRAGISASLSNGLSAFYMAESGLEIGVRLLNTWPLTTCGDINTDNPINNLSLLKGTISLATVNNSPTLGITTLTSAMTNTATSVSVADTSAFVTRGRLLIDGEHMDYTGKTATTFTGIIRGVNKTTPSAHASGSAISQYQCTIASRSKIPNASAPKFQRELQMSVQLQDGWVGSTASVGNFILYRWNAPTEGTWTSYSLNSATYAGTINDISMLSNADGWAVANTANSRFVFLRWNGTAWQLVTISNACSGQHLNAISMVSSRDGWAVGVRARSNNCNNGAYRYTFLHWTGTTWTEVVPSTIPADNNSNVNLNDVRVIDTSGDGIANFGVAVGDSGQIIMFNGSVWTKATSPTTQNLYGVYIVSSTEAWAVGASGIILKWNGSSWSSFAIVSTQLNDIYMIDENGTGKASYGWAVGNSGRIATYNGSTWSTATLGLANFQTIGALRNNDAWAAGDSGIVYHWNGSAWSLYSSGLVTALSGFSFISPKNNPATGWQQIFA